MDVFVQQMCVFSVDATGLETTRWPRWDLVEDESTKGGMPDTLDVKMLYGILIKHTELRDPKALFSDQRRRFHVRRFHS
jgi:hypothetical protein